MFQLKLHAHGMSRETAIEKSDTFCLQYVSW